LEQAAALDGRLGDDRRREAASLSLIAYEEVRDFFYVRRNDIAELDEAAEAIAGEGDLTLGAAALTARLRERRGVVVLIKSDEPEGGDVNRRFDQSRTLRLSPHVTPGQQAFQIASPYAPEGE
jgi:XRE family transcriptional regulator, fatty acid utilization regulator